VPEDAEPSSPSQVPTPAEPSEAPRLRHGSAESASASRLPLASAESAATPAGARRQIEAVLFDFHGTIAQVESPVTWVRAAAAECGAALDVAKATVLADRLVTAGRAGGPLPPRVPPHLIEVWAERDLYEYAHRAAFSGLSATVDTSIEGLADAL